MSVAKTQHHTKRKELRTTSATYLIDEELISLTYILKKKKKTEEKGWDFSGDPVIGALCFHYRGYGFNPWSGNWDPTCFKVRPKKKKNPPEKDKLLQKWVSGIFIEK